MDFMGISKSRMSRYTEKFFKEKIIYNQEEKKHEYRNEPRE